MNCVHLMIHQDGAGTLALIPEEAEDMWHAFNLIAKGDCVRANTIRKVSDRVDELSRM